MKEELPPGVFMTQRCSFLTVLIASTRSRTTEWVVPGTCSQVTGSKLPASGASHLSPWACALTCPSPSLLICQIVHTCSSYLLVLWNKFNEMLYVKGTARSLVTLK